MNLLSGISSGVLPRVRLSPDVHAERTLFLSNRITDYEGLIRFDRTPYLRYPLQVLDMPITWEVLICVATQWGKSTILYCWLNHIVDNDPGPTILVMSTKDQIRDVSTERLQHIVRDSPSMRKHSPRINDFIYEFDEMTMYTGWNSTATVSAHPCKYIVMDETKDLGKDVRDAAVERGKSKVGMKVLEASSPKSETDNIWTGLHLERDRDLEKTFEDKNRKHLPVRRYRAGGDCVVHWIHVPCPKCGTLQQFYPDRIWWPKNCPIRDLTWKAVYKCIHCDHDITDRDKPAMIQAHHWRGADAEILTPGPRNGFHSNSLYSLLGDRCTFGEIAAGWIRASRDPDKAATFLRNWCAIPVEKRRTRCRSRWKTAPGIRADTGADRSPTRSTF